MIKQLFYSSETESFKFKNIFILLFLLLSIPLTVYLALQPQIFRPKARTDQNVTLFDTNGNSLTTPLTVRPTGLVYLQIKDTNWKGASSIKPNIADTSLNLLKQAISLSSREGIRNWAVDLPISKVNDQINGLSDSEKNQLIKIILKFNGASEIEKDKISQATKEILSNPSLGFYAEILSYTDINIEGNGFFGTCNKVMLTPNFVTVSSVRDLLMHEAFHSFNCVNGGPGSYGGSGHINPLDEGSAIWITKAVFPEGRLPNELKAGWAETTYGSKNYGRDIGIVGYPRDVPLVISYNPTQKLKDVYTWLSSLDPSRLPWNNLTKLQSCYDKYYKNIQRNVDFNIWLENAARASSQMAQDINCHPD